VAYLQAQAAAAQLQQSQCGLMLVLFPLKTFNIAAVVGAFLHNSPRTKPKNSDDEVDVEMINFKTGLSSYIVGVKAGCTLQQLYAHIDQRFPELKTEHDSIYILGGLLLFICLFYIEFTLAQNVQEKTARPDSVWMKLTYDISGKRFVIILN
jgi:hypothetical protein